jgi:hypothetical protein
MAEVNDEKTGPKETNKFSGSDVDESLLISFLEGLTPSDLRRILARLPGSEDQVPDTSDHIARVAALMRFVRSTAGPKISTLAMVVRKIFPDANLVESKDQQQARPEDSTGKSGAIGLED